MLSRTTFLVSLLAVALTVPGAHAEEKAAAARPITISSPWARATPGGATVGAAYAEIVNSGAEADRLIAVSSPVAGRVEIHTHIDDGGVMMMRKIDSLEIAGGKSAVLNPGGDHIMLLDLKGPLKAGDTMTATFTFERSGAIEAQIPIAAIGASGPGPNAHGDGAGAKTGHDHGSDHDHHKH